MALADPAATLQRLVDADLLGQLLDRRGRIAELATEAGRVRLDWVDALPRWVEDAEAPRRLDALAEAVLGRGDRLLWSGMGGSVMAVRSMIALGLLDAAPVRLRTLDSTDPRALDRVLADLGGRGFAALGVSMGLTSEEPLSHLRWLGASGLAARRTVMTVRGSMLEEHAATEGLPRVDLQPDGGDATPGRMSAPGTHVFLLPALLASSGAAELHAELGEAVARHGVLPGMDGPQRAEVLASHPAAGLAVRLHHALRQGRDKALVVPGPGVEALAPWVEQLVEESLGKGGRGLLVFPGQPAALLASPPEDCVVLRLDEAVRPGWTPSGPGALAELFAAWTLTVALLGWLEGITFAGQPAVEGYKRHARELRDAPGALDLPPSAPPDVAVARVRGSLAGDPRGYLDITLNADEATPGWAEVCAAAGDLAARLGRPVKLRIAPRHYHSTEQAQVDGPPGVHSLRIALRRTEAAAARDYPPRYLHAQAIGAARAMAEAGRAVELLVLDSAEELGAVAAALRA